MKRIFVDSDIILDVLSNREPFYASAARLLSLAGKGKLAICTTPLCFANIHYIIRKQLNSKETRDALRFLSSIIEIIPIDQNTVIQAIESEFVDFEDGVQYHAAKAAGIDIISTRNVNDYKSSEIPVMSPGEILSVTLNSIE